MAPLPVELVVCTSKAKTIKFDRNSVKKVIEVIKVIMLNK